jgi:hypothetical protein
MADVAAHLVDEVLPEVTVRQWVSSQPWRLPYAMGYDRKLCADVLDAFITSLCRSLRRRAKSRLGLRSVEDVLFGAVTFILAPRLLAAPERASSLPRARWRARER